MPTRSPKWQEECIAVMEHAFARGSVPSLRFFIASYEDMIAFEGSEITRQKLARLREEARAARGEGGGQSPQA